MTVVWYSGLRGERGVRVTVESQGDRGDRNSSQMFGSFDWGQNGQQAVNLARAIILHANGDEETAFECGNGFAETVLAEIEDESWTLTRAAVLANVAEIQRRVAA